MKLPKLNEVFTTEADGSNKNSYLPYLGKMKDGDIKGQIDIARAAIEKGTNFGAKLEKILVTLVTKCLEVDKRPSDFGKHKPISPEVGTSQYIPQGK